MQLTLPSVKTPRVEAASPIGRQTPEASRKLARLRRVQTTGLLQTKVQAPAGATEIARRQSAPC